jgi:hypothetical protein
MASTDLTADCARCAALCCVGLAFDRSSLFAFDKAAGVPCANLDAGGRCRIHADLAIKGFGGCRAFDCQGAGQAVTQGLFGGASWREDPAVLAPMMRAFSVMRPAHEALGLLRQARRLPLPASVLEHLAAVERGLEPAGGWTRRDVEDGRVERATETAQAFLRSLAPLLEAADIGRDGAGLRRGA